MQIQGSPSNRLSRVFAAGIIGLFAAGCADQATSPPTMAPNSHLTALQQPQGHRHIVRLKVAGTESAVLAAVKAEGGQVEAVHSESGLLTVNGLSDAAAARISARGEVAAVAADVVLQWVPVADPNAQRVYFAGTAPGTAPGTQADQSGAFFYRIGYQWNMSQVKAIEAQRSTPAGQGRTVCVLDTGVDPGQQELVGRVNLAVSKSFVATEPFIEDYNFHGTHVASTITSNGVAIASIAPNATLCAVKVLSYTGSGSFAGVIDGIFYAATSRSRGGAGADVINMSLGAYVDRTQPGVQELIDAQQKAVDFAWKQGVLVVVSAGNSGIDLKHDGPQFLEVPAELKHVVTVGATGPIDLANPDHFASYSNFGTNTLVAPGGDVLGVTPTWFHDFVLAACSRYVCGADGYYIWSAGTSMAAPHVAGAGAVLMSVRQPDGEPDEFVEALQDGADRVGPSSQYGAGRLNVLGASKAVND